MLDAVSMTAIAAGGIADRRGVTAALALGAAFYVPDQAYGAGHLFTIVRARVIAGDLAR